MAVVDMIAAFAMGTLSGMGIGGGGLLVIYLTLLKGIGQIEAQGLNLYFFLFASAAALFVHSVKREINYPLVLLLGVCGMPFALFGSYFASVVNPNTVKVLFGMMLVVAGGISFAKTITAVIKSKKK